MSQMLPITPNHDISDISAALRFTSGVSRGLRLWGIYLRKQKVEPSLL